LCKDLGRGILFLRSKKVTKLFNFCNRYPVRGTNSVSCMYDVKSPLSLIRSSLSCFSENGSSIVTRLSYKNLSFHDSNCWGVILAECHIEYFRSIRIMNGESWFSLHLPLRQVFCSFRLYYGRPTLMEKGRFARSQNKLRGLDCSVIVKVTYRLKSKAGTHSTWARVTVDQELNRNLAVQRKRRPMDSWDNATPGFELSTDCRISAWRIVQPKTLGRVNVRPGCCLVIANRASTRGAVALRCGDVHRTRINVKIFWRFRITVLF
jgi:hypothetical protein